MFVFFTDTGTTGIYTRTVNDALPSYDSACQRAAHRRAKLGRCKLARIWCSNSLDVRSAMISVYSPDALDPEYFAKTRYENNLPTSGPELSDRVIAERLHVSHATVASVR